MKEQHAPSASKVVTFDIRLTEDIDPAFEALKGRAQGLADPQLSNDRIPGRDKTRERDASWRAVAPDPWCVA